jgi:XTP/dITP diphosphohydrolase
MELLFASQNASKCREWRSILPGNISIKSLLDIGHLEELQETENSFEGNALAKASQGYQLFGNPCFAEDAGLVIPALQGRPGVLSARYAGLQKNPFENIQKVLQEMTDVTDRTAYFIAIIAFYDGSVTKTFEGRVYGQILNAPRGEEGFGYDPIFQPLGWQKSFGELESRLKNKMSHRAKSIALFLDWLADPN